MFDAVHLSPDLRTCYQEVMMMMMMMICYNVSGITSYAALKHVLPLIFNN